MADFDRRYHRGGFNHGRKRRFRDDAEFDRRAQRRRYEEPLHIKLRKQLLGLAESPTRNVEEEIGNAAKNAIELSGDEEHLRHFVETTTRLVFEQPPKIPFLASFIMACHFDNSKTSTALLDAVWNTLQTHMQAGSWREVKLGLRLFACLQPILEGDGVFTLLEELFSKAVDLQTTSSEDALGLELVKIILLSIAYLMASPASGFEERAVALLEKTDIIASAPHSLDEIAQPFLSGGDDVDARQPQTMIGLLQHSLQTESTTNWELRCIPRPWKNISAIKPADETAKYSLPEFTVPTSASSGNRLRFPEQYLSVYSDQDIETVPSPASVTCPLVRDVLVDTINVLDFNRNIAAKILIDVDCYFAAGTFASRGTPFDKLKDLPEEKSKWKPEDVAVDAVFSQLLQLPTPEHKLVYFHSVLTEACKLAPAAIAPSLGRAIRYLYRNLEFMDLELQHRFLDWFSHHLSNFGFTWKWTEWADDVELPAIHVRKAFITGLLEKEVRLSVVQRVQGTLPETYHPLLPDGKEEDEPPPFKFASEDIPFASEGRHTLQLIRKKAPEPEIEVTLESIQTLAQERGFEDPSLAVVDVFATCVCFAGSKSLSHLLSYIERCKERLLVLSASSDAAKQQIVSSVMTYWSEKPGTGVNIVDKLLNYSILSPKAVIQWALADGAALTKAHIYELVAGTMFKVTNRVRQVTSARAQENLPVEQASLIDQTLTQEQAEMRNLFAMLDARLVESLGSSDAAPGAEADLGSWAQRWLRVFRRKLRVEESWQAQELEASAKQDTDMQNGQVEE